MATRTKAKDHPIVGEVRRATAELTHLKAREKELLGEVAKANRTSAALTKEVATLKMRLAAKLVPKKPKLARKP